MKKNVRIKGHEFELRTKGRTASLTEVGGGWEVINIYELEDDRKLSDKDLAQFIVEQTGNDPEIVYDEVLGGWHKQFGEVVVSFMDGPGFPWDREELERYIEEEKK